MDPGGPEKKKPFEIDSRWEYDAPAYYDFLVGETEQEKVAAEKWLEAETSYDASPHVGKSKTVAELLNLNPSDEDMEVVVDPRSPHEDKENQQQPEMSSCMKTPIKNLSGAMSSEVGGSAARRTLEESTIHNVNEPSSDVSAPSAPQQEGPTEADVSPNTPLLNENAGVRYPERTPLSAMPSSFTAPPGSLPAKSLYPHGWKEAQAIGSLTMPKQQKPASARHYLNGTNRKDPHCRLRSMLSPDNNPPAHKKQKLEEGRLRQIRERIVRPKENNNLTVPQEFQFCTDKRSRTFGGAECSTASQGGRPPSPFVSLAEKVRRFQLKTPERFHTNTGGSQELMDDQEKRKLKLTKPKTPEFETSHRTRQIKVKSTAELEEEMLAKVPKFKARPAPKKILEPQPPPTVQKPAPQAPEFQEFHLRTMERAMQHKCAELRDASTQQQGSSVAASTDSFAAELKRGVSLVEPPHLLTATRVRPTTVKSREEQELEELANMPKFKARPLNKRIFESRGDMGVYRNCKREVTQIQEFHFATDERLKHHEQPSSLADILSKMSINQQQQENVPHLTVPEPFHLETENRGALKEMKFKQEIEQREQEEIEKRIPKAQLLPFTTTIRADPPKPVTKEVTRPEPFQLESVIRHVDEQQRIAEERKRAEEMEAAMKAFRAQPNLSKIPVPFVPLRSRKPLTEVQEFQFQLDTRAAERAEFERKMIERQNQYKRFRDVCEAARKEEEERIVKAMRKEMVPHARPMPVFGRPFVPERSNKEPTRPVSPALMTEAISRRPTSQRRRSSMTSTAQMRRRMMGPANFARPT
ncbi:hypothetical protein R1flu_002168 [Riccia fluitans]|uniref:Targeting protein for Xklp2 n=1 Tax=Riccia fluitans TaxID=41844 RepID=A0ABD1Y5M2_9MARC